MRVVEHGVVQPNPYIFQKTLHHNYYFINLNIPNIQVLLFGLSNWHDWHHVDVFSFVDNDILARIRNDKDFYIFIDMAEEGFDPINQFNFWNNIESSIKNNNIPANKVFYFSCNLQDIEASKQVSFRVHVEHMWWSWQNDLHDFFNIDKEFKRAIKNTTRLHDKKYYSSLNRAPRFYRTYLNACLYHSSAGVNGLFSQMPIPEDHFKYNRDDINWNMLENFNKVLPITIDSATMQQPLHNYKHILDSSIFHIANETVISKKYNRLMITEKTFKAISTFTPMIIFASGSPNKQITDYGFKTYADYFDIDAFDVETPIDKINSIVQQTKELCKQFAHMTKTQRIDWKFKEEGLLKHNFSVFRADAFNKLQRKKLVSLF